MDVIIVEILPRLPAKTLIRFKSVCKSLNSVISSRDFVRLYLRHQTISSSAADKRLVVAGDQRINCYHLDPHATTTTTTIVYDESSPIMSVIGACNGLLCIRLSRFNSSDFCILNPTTQICRYISTLREEFKGSHNHGFGFNHENLDYIIVAVFNYIDNNSAMQTQITRVYSLNKNLWRVIDKTNPTDTMDPLRKGGVLIDNNLLHWMFWIPTLHQYRIGCFDICKNKWTDGVLLPRFYYDPTYNKEMCYLVDFGVVDDCLFSTFKNGIENRYDVWVMKEYGVQESWVMLLSIPNSNCVQRGGVLNPVVCCQNSDKVLIRQHYSCRFFWYNKVDGGISEAKFDGVPNFWNLQACMCSSCLVHIPDGQLFEYFQVLVELSFCT